MYKLVDNSYYEGRDFFNFEATSKLPRHRWYYLKEGFSSSSLLQKSLTGDVEYLNNSV